MVAFFVWEKMDVALWFPLNFIITVSVKWKSFMKLPQPFQLLKYVTFLLHIVICVWKFILRFFDKNR